jgi:hypothetical protein
MVSTYRTSILTSLLFTTLTMAMPLAASAEPIAAEQATQLLARSQSLEEKCKFLLPAQRDELSAFVAKAEVAMVARSSVKATKALINVGRAQGKAAACNDAERADVVDIISAAQQATSRKIQMVHAPAPTQPIALATKIEKPKPLFSVFKKPIVETKPEPIKSGLGQYAQLTQRYYLARRCNSMSYGSINSLYKNVVSTHRLVVASFGVPAVRAVMQQSEHQANTTHCG